MQQGVKEAQLSWCAHASEIHPNPKTLNPKALSQKGIGRLTTEGCSDACGPACPQAHCLPHYRLCRGVSLTVLLARSLSKRPLPVSSWFKTWPHALQVFDNKCNTWCPDDSQLEAALTTWLCSSCCSSDELGSFVPLRRPTDCKRPSYLAFRGKSRQAWQEGAKQGFLLPQAICR